MEHTREIIDYSWEHKVNPNNTPWMPGYRFFVRQESTRQTGDRMRPRRYHVQFKIDKAGNLEWCGGVKATVETWARVRALYVQGIKDQQPRPKDP